MSQTKAQLVAPVGVVTASSMTVTGVLTATTLDGNVIGAAVSIAQGKNLNVGVITALSFSGNLTGDAGGLIGSPNTVAGVVTANSFVGGITGNITGDVIGNASGIGASIKSVGEVIATKTDGTLWTWGDNGPGALMLNDRTDRSSPTQVPGTWNTGERGIRAADPHFALKVE